MSDLDEVLGALVASVARARLLADQETIAIAEQYRDHPLLRGMSVPRVRIPDVTIDLPVVVEGHVATNAGEAQSPASVRNAIADELKIAAAELGTSVPSGMLTAIRKEFDVQMRGRTPKSVEAAAVYGEATNQALATLARDPKFAQSISRDQLAEFQRRLTARARAESVKNTHAGAKFAVKVTTAEVKAESDPASITRLRMTLREEGLEWAMYDRDDGTEGQQLVPE